MFRTLIMVRSRQPGRITPSEQFLAAIGPALDVEDLCRIPLTYVVDSATMTPVEPILEYLVHSVFKNKNVETTLKNKADALYEWFLYLLAIQLDYRDVDWVAIADYRDRSGHFISGKTHAPLAKGTIDARVRIIEDFCRHHGIVAVVAQNSPSVRRTSGHRGGGRGATSTGNATVVEYVSDADLRLLLAALGDEPGTKRGRPSRDWLVAVFCVTTGARISEALLLTTHQLDICAMEPSFEGCRTLRLEKTKGSKPRTIKVPDKIVEHLVGYMEGERAEAVRQGSRNRLGGTGTSILFVNGIDCPAPFVGMPYKTKRAEERFAKAQMSVKLTRKVPVYDLELHPETGDRTVIGHREVPKHVEHHLRHTYAIRAWHAYAHLTEADRWMRIQGQLGHESWQTTADTYLRAVKGSEADARDTLSGFFKGLFQA